MWSSQADFYILYIWCQPFHLFQNRFAVWLFLFSQIQWCFLALLAPPPFSTECSSTPEYLGRIQTLKYLGQRHTSYDLQNSCLFKITHLSSLTKIRFTLGIHQGTLGHCNDHKPGSIHTLVYVLTWKIPYLFCLNIAYLISYRYMYLLEKYLTYIVYVSHTWFPTGTCSVYKLTYLLVTYLQCLHVPYLISHLYTCLCSGHFVP